MSALSKYSFFGKRSIAFRVDLPSKAIHEVDGIRFCIDASNAIHRLALFKEYEPEDLSRVLSVVKAGDVCLDVGANMGVYSFYMSKKVGVSGKVYAFEPRPEIYEQLAENAGINPSLNVQPIQKAVSHQAGKLNFYADPKNPGTGSVVKASNNEVLCSVDTLSLDDFLLQEGIDRVGVMKIDIEGHEMSLVQGAQKSLAAHVFSYIFVEFNTELVGLQESDKERFISAFTDHGYNFIDASILDKGKRFGKWKKGFSPNLMFVSPSVLS